MHSNEIEASSQTTRRAFGGNESDIDKSSIRRSSQADGRQVIQALACDTPLAGRRLDHW